jgi:uncharacterized protein (DUF1330 family)
MSIYITQLIYVKQGEETVFHQFEDIAIPIIKNYGGKLLLRIRPHGDQVIDGIFDPPYEIHLIEFTHEDDFQNFMHDDERKKFLHLKEKSIESVLLIKGSQI